MLEASESYASAMAACIGDEPVNDGKFAEEGQWATACVQLGVGTDTESETVWIPEAKIQKGYHASRLPSLRYGRRRVPLINVQRPHGLLQAWVVVYPALAHVLAVLRLMLRSFDDLWCRPAGSAEQVDGIWIEFWEGNEFV